MLRGVITLIQSGGPNRWWVTVADPAWGEYIIRAGEPPGYVARVGDPVWLATCRPR
jgi:hypothetical protein